MNELIRRWSNAVSEAELLEELNSLQTQERRQDLKDAFYKELSFGTGGLRGVIGVGPNRMNVYTVGKATQGLADYLNATFKRPSVAIARDSRLNGELFVKAAASVLAANGIKVYVYPRIEPTPALSFAVRYLGCSAGVCVTASHNPAEYNGYKVYGSDGCQITTIAAVEIQQAIDKVDIFRDVRTIDFDVAMVEKFIEWIPEETLDAYIDSVLDLACGSFIEDLKLVYTPLNGSGLECVSRMFEKIGIEDVSYVLEQTEPDGRFPTCPYPNPEVREALQRGLELCPEVGADLLLATDPDADRVGIAVKHRDKYMLLNGNEVGILLLDYLCQMGMSNGEDLKSKVVISTIVSSAMADALSDEYGFELRRTLTGFKYIGEQIRLLEESGQVERFLFGFEESYGYLSGTHVRDKDAVNASLLICEMAAWYKRKGVSLIEAMESLYKRHGFYKNDLITVAYPGVEGARKMGEIIKGLRETQPMEIANLKVTSFSDYGTGASMPILNSLGELSHQELPSSDVLEFKLEGGNMLLIRPSGTEPKVKAYLFAKGISEEEVTGILLSLRSSAERMLTS